MLAKLLRGPGRWPPAGLLRRMAALSGLLALVLATGAAAEPPGPGPAQREGAAHGGPRAYHAMCARAPALCMHDRRAGRAPGAGPVAVLDAALLGTLRQVNARINARMIPADDRSLHAVSDHWSAGGRAGDCEDYMIAKKQALLRAGMAADQLLYAVVEGRTTPYHAVLVVRTDRGDLVLDNLTGAILPWDETGYRFIIRQSAANPHRWVRVETGARLSAAPSGGLVTR